MPDPPATTPDGVRILYTSTTWVVSADLDGDQRADFNFDVTADFGLNLTNEAFWLL